MRKLLWVGDAACPSGFARATHEILNGVKEHFDVTVLGLNYRGDPHNYPYPIYAAAPGGDLFGIGRLIWMCDLIQPDVIVIQNDGWNIPDYVQQLRRFPDFARVPVVAAIAADGKNFQGAWLNGVQLAIFWTDFALEEARLGGFNGEAEVIPLGVDLNDYHPIDQRDARARRVGAKLPEDIFFVGNVNRNQPRKRWDLTVRYFARWINEYDIKNAYLYLHAAPTGDAGVDVVQLSKYYGVLDYVAISQPPIWYGVSEEIMRDTYNCFDIQISTTQGEGFGLTTFEGMACGIPQIVPDWSALGELCQDAAILIPCSSTAIGPPYINVIGGVPDEEQFISAMHRLYQKSELRELYSRKGLMRVSEQRFRWETVGKRFIDAINSVVKTVETNA